MRGAPPGTQRARRRARTWWAVSLAESAALRALSSLLEPMATTWRLMLEIRLGTRRRRSRGGDVLTDRMAGCMKRQGAR